MKLRFGFRIWLLIIVLILSLISIFITPTFLQDGVIIASVDSNSTAFEQGLRQGQVIIAIDGKEITSLEDFTNILQGKYNSNESVKTIITTKDSEVILFSKEAPEITVSEVSKTNIRLGLDLAGGSRALIKAEGKKLSSAEINDLVDITRNRLNEFGLTDLKVMPVSDLEGNHFMLIEIAGATPGDLEEMISEQGKFEAKIVNDTVFVGGERDIASVCRNDATCAAIESCQQAQDGSYFCNFRFAVYLSEAAAERHAEITDKLEVNASSQGSYLSEKLDLYVDDNLLDSLLIGEGLKGRVTTQISISGSGSGETEDIAYDEAQKSMHKLQTILITGSLPYKLEIVKLDTISPVLGKQFIKSILLAAIAALLVVAIIIFIRYKTFKSSIALLFTSTSEIVIILGIASFISWNLDLPSIAGILATIGTGIDQQIIILDEAKQKTILSLKQKLKRAFSIILGAYFTAVVALIPLLWAGAGLLKGFAITTIIGITAGVLITRPAFTEMVKRIEA
jgi:preprotein translocase subunit SecD